MVTDSDDDDDDDDDDDNDDDEDDDDDDGDDDDDDEICIESCIFLRTHLTRFAMHPHAHKPLHVSPRREASPARISRLNQPAVC